MAARGYREYDPEFTAAQLLSTVNGLGKNLFTVGDANLDFNSMLDQQNQYDARDLAVEEARRKKNYQDEISQGFSDNPDMTLEEAAQLKKKAAGEFGDIDTFQKSVKEAAAESDRKKLADLAASNTDVKDILEEARKQRLLEGDVEGYSKLKPDKADPYLKASPGTTFLKQDANGNLIPIYTSPDRPRSGGEGTPVRFFDLDTGKITVVNSKDTKALAKLGPNIIRADSADQNDREAMRANIEAQQKQIKEEQVRAEKEAAAKRDADLTKQAIQLMKQAAIENQSVGAGQSAYEKLMPAKPTVRRRVVMR